MGHRLTTLLLLLIFPHAGYAQDSLFWNRYDGIVDSLFRTVDTGDEALAVMAPLLAERRRTGPISPDLAYRYHRIALMPTVFGNARSLRYADTAILLRTEAKAVRADIAQSVYQRGRVLKNMSRHRSALRDFEAALRMMREAYETATDDPTRQDIARRLGYFYREAANSARENGDFGLADLWLDEIPALLEVGPNPRTEFEAGLTRADVHNDAGRYERAVQSYRALIGSSAYAGAGKINQTVALQNLGTALNRAGQAEAARTVLEEAADRHLAAGRTRRLSFVRSELISVLNRLGAPDEAEEMFAAGLADARRAYPGDKAAVLGELHAHAAETKALRGDFAAAQSLLRAGAAALIEDPVFAGPADLPVLADALLYSKEELLTVLTTKRAAYLRAYTNGADPTGLESALLTARTIDTLFRNNRSELSLTTSLADLFRLENEAYEAAVDIALRLYRSRGEARYLTEAYRFATGRKSQLLRKYLAAPGLAETFGVAPELAARKTDLEWRIALAENALRVATGDVRAALRDSLLELRGLEREARRRLTADHPAYVRAVRGLPEIDPIAAAAELSGDRVVADYFLGADSIYLFTLARTDGLAVRVMPRPAGLANKVATVLTDSAAAAELYGLLVAPVLAGRPEARRLQFIPDGELWRIPFAALRRNDRYLTEDYAVSYAYAAALLFDPAAHGFAAETPDGFLGYGISYKDVLLNLSPAAERGSAAGEVRSMGRLPWAGREVSSAADIMAGDARLEAEATKARFLAEAGRGGIVHLSMHGLLRPNPMESALAFRGEEAQIDPLTMGEVLGGRYPHDLTVLSACHTGGGPVRTAEGMQSLGRAFTAAGSRATITSTWAARDDATHDILVGFYRRLHDGAPKDVALQGAVNAYLAAGTPTDRLPENWANLTLIGRVDGPNGGSNWWWYLPLGFGLALGVGGYFLWGRRKGVR